MLAKEATGERSVSLLGASINQQAPNVGVVDAIMVHLAPMFIGEGIRR
jgi:riboflavin biosynthesis pyrimidine reductase